VPGVVAGVEISTIGDREWCGRDGGGEKVSFWDIVSTKFPPSRTDKREKLAYMESSISLVRVISLRVKTEQRLLSLNRLHVDQGDDRSCEDLEVGAV
jgi:hypothetical protein